MIDPGNSISLSRSIAIVLHIAAVHTLDLAARNRYRVAAGTGGYGICFCTGIRFRAFLCRDSQNAHKHRNVIAIPCTAAVDDARGSDRIQCDRIAISIAGLGFPACNFQAAWGGVRQIQRNP